MFGIPGQVQQMGGLGVLQNCCEISQRKQIGFNKFDRKRWPPTAQHHHLNAVVLQRIQYIFANKPAGTA